MARPITSSGPGGDQNDGGFGAQQMLQGPSDRAFLLDGGEDEAGGGSEPIKTLAHDIFKELARAFSIGGVRVEDRHSR